MQGGKDKFTPHKIDKKCLLNREAKIGKLRNQIETKSVFLIQAKAGQGKSYFAKLFTDSYYKTTLWYKVSEPDKDPVLFCKNLYTLFKSKIKKYECEFFSEKMNSGKLDPIEYENYIKELTKSLKKHLKERIALVISDTHILSRIGISCKLIQTMMSLTSKKFHIIVTSRNKCHFSGAFIKLNKSAYHIDDDFLSFSENEFKELALKKLASDIDLSKVGSIYKLSEGWAEGITRAFDFINEYGIDRFYEDKTSYLGDYFEFIIDGIKESKLSKQLMLLSLLDSIDINFATEVCSSNNIVNLLYEMHESNSFIQMVSASNYKIHPLFGECLRKLCRENISKDEISSFFKSAADFESKRENTVKALSYLSMGERFNDMETLVREQFPEIVSTDRQQTMRDAFAAIPSETYKENAWLPLAYGYIMLPVSPEQTEKIFSFVISRFEISKDKTGEVLSACGLLYYHCLISGDYEKAHNCFIKLKEYYSANENDEAEEIKLILNFSYALASVYLDTGENPKLYMDKALSIASTKNIFHYKVELLCLYSTYHSVRLDIKSQNDYCSKIMMLLSNSAISMYQRILIKGHLYEYFSLVGKKNAMEKISKHIRLRGRLYLENNYVLKTYMDMWDIDISMSKGDFDTAKRISERYSQYEIDTLPKHIASIVTYYKAIVLAFECDDNAVGLAENAIKLRKESKSAKCFQSMSIYFAGAVHAILGNHKNATKYLEEAMQLSSNGVYDNSYTGANAYLSYLNNNISNKVEARDYAYVTMRFLKKNNMNHFWGVLPEVMINSCYHARGFETIKDYAEMIAYDKHDITFNDKGHPIPVMQINTLGSIAISFGNYTLEHHEISQNFRLMMAIILSSKNYQVSQEVIQAYIWPSSDKEKARKSFDNLVSRFRSLLSTNFSGINPKDYITVQNGILSFKNVKSNADEFVKFYDKAYEHYMRGEYTLALENLADAEKIFSDRYIPMISDADEIERKKLKIDNAFVGMMELMYKLNNMISDIFDIEKHINDWLDSFYHETSLVKTAYSYYRNKNRIVKCRNLIDRYRAYLEGEMFTEEDINELIYTVKSQL